MSQNKAMPALGTYACCARPVLPHHRHCPVCHALVAMADEVHVCAGEALRQAAEAVVQAWMRMETVAWVKYPEFDKLIHRLYAALGEGRENGPSDRL